LRLRKQLADSGLDAGADTIGWHLAHRHQLTLSRATIHRILTRAGAVTPEPAKRPKSSYIRFAAEQPNETWQSDFTHYRLATGADTEIITWLDDHSRLALHVSAHPRITGPIVLATFRQAAGLHGYPASTLTDNGMVYTTRFSGGRGGRNHLEHELRRLNITQKNSRPNYPTTCGKVERFQQTLKKWLRAQPGPPAPLTAAPGHPSDRLQRPTQSHTRRRAQPRLPRPGPHRPHRPDRLRHPPPGRPPAPHRHRPNPLRNPRPATRPGPARPRHRRRHRRTPPRAHHRPRPRLPAHRPTTRPRPQMTNARTHISWVRASGMSCDITPGARQGSNPRPSA